MTSDPFYSGDDEPAPDLDALELPEHPTWRRCVAVHAVEQGPWVGTLICCTRKVGHPNEHLTTLGDIGSPDYWQEFWL